MKSLIPEMYGLKHPAMIRKYTPEWLITYYYNDYFPSTTWWDSLWPNHRIVTILKRELSEKFK